MSRVIAQGLIVLLLLGVLVLAPVAVVSASAPQLWYLDTDHGYPLPELATAILLGAGLLGLLAYSRMKPVNSPTQP